MSKASIPATKSPSPFFSVIIPVHNRKKTVAQAIASIQNQTFKDVEIIVVDDASTDTSTRIIKKIQAQDDRIKTVFLPQNSGTHYARKKGVEQAVGEYALFLDADDELEEHTLQKLKGNIDRNHSDIIIFQFQVLSVCKTNKTIKNMLQWLNNQVPCLNKQDLLKAIYVEPTKTSMTWNILGKAFRTSLLKQRLALTTNSHLFYGEDAYELFTILSGDQAHTWNYLPYQGYIYHLGTGVSSQHTSTAAKFIKVFKSAECVLIALQKFIQTNCNSISESIIAREVYYGFAQRLALDLIEQWEDTLNKRSKAKVLPSMLSSYAHAFVESELWRRLKDKAYDAWISHQTNSVKALLQQAQDYEAYLNIAHAFANTIVDRKTFYQHVYDILARLNSEKMISDIPPVVIPVTTAQEIALPGTHICASKFIIPICFYNDLQTYTTLRLTIQDGTVLSKHYFWDLFVLDTGLSKRQKDRLLKEMPVNMRLNFVACPSGEAIVDIHKKARVFLPYPTYLAYGDLKILNHSHPAVEYFNRIAPFSDD